MSTATPEDVKGVIDTNLSDSDIQNYLDDAEYRNGKFNDVTEQSTADITQIEKYLAALLIVETKDPRHTQASSSSRSVSYEAGRKQDLRRRVQELDPSGKLANAAFLDNSRNVTSTR